MLNLKKYIILSANANGKYTNYPSISIKVKTGILAEDLKLQLENNRWTPDDKDRLYFFPGCSVPRFKIKDRFNTTIKPEYATAAFISANDLKTSENMFTVHSQMYKRSLESTISWFNRIYGSEHHLSIKLKSLALNVQDDVLFHEDDSYQLNYKCPDDALYPNTFKDWMHSCGNNSINHDNTRFYQIQPDHQLSKITCPIYLQDEIIKLLNDKQTVIDEKMYRELNMMLDSSDSGNIILAMELMANANFKESFVHLFFLLKKHSRKIGKQKKEVNHVNFKSLLTFMGLTEKTMCNIDIESILTQLKKHKQFTRRNVQQISSLFSGNGYDTTHFTTGPVLRIEHESILDDEIELPEQDDESLIESDEDNFNL